ncbi:phage major capsid protein [Turicibacter sanguinis]|nr:phage major capsid protein [Turicibacter sanguinis]
MPKLIDLERELTELQNKVEALKNEGKIDEAHQLIADITNKKEEIKKYKEIEASLKNEFENQNANDDSAQPKNKTEVSLIHAWAKQTMGRQLTDEEETVLKNVVAGEEHIQIKELSTRIRELLREERTSLKTYVTVHKTKAKSGQFPILSLTDAVLKEVTDGVEMTEESDGIGFSIITFNIKKYGRLFVLNDTVLKFSAADLINYVARLFVMCYIRTINEAITKKLLFKTDGVTREEHKVIATVSELVSCTRAEMDGALQSGANLYMHALTFDKLAKDENKLNGLSWIQPDLTKPAIPYINGFKVVLTSKELEPYENEEADKKIYPILFANLKQAIYLFEDEAYKTDLQKNFRRNCVDQKIISYFDVQKVDGEASVLLGLEETM